MRLWTNIFLPVKALLEFLLTFKDETIAHKLNDTHKSNAGLLLLGAFADWVGNRLSLYLMEAGTDKGQDPLEIRAFRQKESTATLIPIVSKLRCFFGGGEGSRTPVRKQFHGMFSGRRRLFRAALPPCSPPGGQAATPTGQVRVIMHGTVNSFRTHVHCETTPSLSRSPLKSDGCQQLGSDS